MTGSGAIHLSRGRLGRSAYRGEVARLDGRRVLVVGASRGLGHAFATRLVTEGASVVAAARTVPEAPGTVGALGCDVRNPESCHRLVSEAVEQLGGLDALVYAPGVTVVTELKKASADHWGEVLETNVIGAGLVTAAAVEHLDSSEGVAIYLSSVSAHVTPPWIGMGLYAISKVALEKMAEVWKLEHPLVRFTTMIIGSTGGTSFFASATKPSAGEVDRFVNDWRARGYLAQEQLRPEDQAEVLVDVLLSRAQIDQVWVRPRTLLQRWE
jgi:NAD(P)-dependent dehydrogenase (short-subunit alcohol dehydrogenase family)